MTATPLGAATTYTYDNLGRLSIATYDSGLQVVYGYDAAGNRTSVVTRTSSDLPPVANNDNITVRENTADQFKPLANDTDPQNYQLTVSGLGTPSNGTVAYSTCSDGSQCV